MPQFSIKDLAKIIERDSNDATYKYALLVLLWIGNFTRLSVPVYLFLRSMRIPILSFMISKKESPGLISVRHLIPERGKY